jgi:oligosaccharide 4-alpha-D-glucosyltransferase
LIWAKLLDEKYAIHYPNERLFNLTRSGYAGMQRYSTFPWSGDIQRSFSGLQAQIPIMLGAGMSGLGYMHSDVGGFTGNDNDAELFTRWVQFGVFAPILRMHGVGTTEPVNFSDPYRTIMRKYIKLRYQLLPYNYTLAYENSMYGTPLARQINYYEPQNTSLSDINDSYLWGKNFLVAPVLERSVNQRPVVFPEGKWISYHNLKEYQGNTTYSVSCSINDIPLFVRAGSFIPTAHPMESTSDYKSDSLVIKYYPDIEVPESYGYMFADDGFSTTSISAQEFELLHFNGHINNNDITIDITKNGSYLDAPQTRNMQFEIIRIASKPDLVEIDDIAVTEVNSISEFQSVNPAFFWDESKSTLFVNCSLESSARTIRITSVLVGVQPNLDMQTNEFLLHNPWPNPFYDELTISADIVMPGEYAFSIQSSTGISVLHFEKNFTMVGRETFTLSLQSNLPSGVYFLIMRGKTGTQIKRVVKLK